MERRKWEDENGRMEMGGRKWREGKRIEDRRNSRED
jgi:hypothetical protein